jgi:hypothetical protein
MGIFDWFSRKRDGTQSSALTPGAIEFLNGKRNILTSADVDPENAEKYAGYERAMVLKKACKFSEAAEILLKSCDPPSIYKGHYKELFKIWRQFNRDDLNASRHQEVVNRVLTMVRLDDEMIREMLRYWSIQQKKELPPHYFDNDRNLLLSDAKALKKAAEALGQNRHVEVAVQLIERFSKS